LKFYPQREDLRQDPTRGGPWFNVDVKVGGRLIFSSCGNNDKPFNRFVISKEGLFPIIQNIISYDAEISRNQNLVSDIAQTINNEKSKVFEGYIITHFWLGSHNDNTAVSLVNLLSVADITGRSGGWIEAMLMRIVSRQGNGAMAPDTRNFVISHLVEVGAGDSENSRYAIHLLALFAGAGKVDLKSYVDEEKRQRLVTNYQKFDTKILSPREKSEFERQLMIN